MNKIKKYTEIPFSPAKFPFFYGWIIIILGIAGVLMSIPGQTMGVSVFTDDLIRVLGLSRVNLSLAYMIGTITSALILTPAGKRLDRYGARNMGTVVIVLFGLMLIFMAKTDRILFFLKKLIPGEGTWTAFILIILSFFLLRFLGQGMLTLISRNMVMKWFDRYRGLANAVLGVCTSFGFSFAPRVLNSLIQSGGWNGAWMLIGIFILTFGTAVFWLFSRDNPLSCGMSADGNIKINTRRKRPAGKPEADFTLGQARKTLPFWAFGLTLGMNSLFVTAFTFHIVSIFETVGLGRTDAVAIFLPASFISVAVNFAGSMLSDYIKLRYILIVHAFSIMLSMFFLANLSSGFNMIMFIIGFGIMGGLFNISNSIVWPRYYGTGHLGAITGMIMGIMVVGSALGPYFFSLVKNITGTYRAASIICLIIMTAITVFAFRVRRPVHPDSVRGSEVR